MVSATDEGRAVDVIREISNGSFKLGVLPELGGSVTHLIWSPPSQPAVALLRTAQAADIASGNPSRLASFAMVPFTNRIDQGRIVFVDRAGAARSDAVPINRPAQNAAIHGFGRAASWTVAEAGPSRLVLRQDFAQPGIPYAYEAEQIFTVSQAASVWTLRVVNRGRLEMPFGIGFHPWFDRTPKATLALAATHAFAMDGRDMPIRPVPIEEVTGTAMAGSQSSFVVEARTPFDTPLAGWGGTAVLTWPERDLRLTIEAEGAFRLVHVFSPRVPAVFCVEPVSHVPDVINRRSLAPLGDMTVLGPGESMEGAMRLTPSRLA